MPFIQSDYQAPFWLRNGHLATIIPSAFRKVKGVNYTRERITTPDDDFLDLDWVRHDANKLVVITHGLEGNSSRPYVLGMAKYFSQNNWEVLAWNCRSCSGEINKTARFYHHGATDDLETVINHALSLKDYNEIVLVGFSMGGSLSVKYIGERKSDLHKSIKAGIAFSIPVNLKSSVDQLAKPFNNYYRKRFIKKLEAKVKEKATKYPGLIHYDSFENIKYFPDFDNKYTAPIHGFRDAEHFYELASAGKYMEQVKVPVLICNALNDPFLPNLCYPYSICENHKYLYLETPKYGGHVGFTKPNSPFNYMEKRALQFVESLTH